MRARTGLLAVTSLLLAAAAAPKGSILDQGEASWYGPRHAGLRTTSGAIFDPARMTAAHPSLPLGSWVRVTDDVTGKSVVVQVNDREPAHGVRCIDLSEGAARRLGIIRQGLADVTLTAASEDEATEVAEAPGLHQIPLHRLTAIHGRRHRRPARR